MELQALLVLGGVGVAVVAVVLLMGLFSASGTSYEEAIAQQRKATTELLALAENKEKTKKNSKKAIKKLAKKEKNREASNVMTGSEAESEVPAESSFDEDVPVVGRPHVEFSPPVVVDVPRDSLPNVKIRKRGKDPKVKPILINKEDPSCINDPSTPPSPSGSNVSNHFEEIHPKDEFELLISSLAADKASEKNEELVEKKVVIEKKEAAEKKEGKAGKHGKGGKAANKQPATTEAAKEEGGREGRGASEGAKEQRKGKKSEKKPTAEEVQDTSRETGAATPSESRAPAPAADPPVAPAAPAPAPAAASGPAAAPAPNPAPANVTPPGGGRNKKKKAEPNVLSLMAGDSGGVSAVELVRVVRDAVLSRDEIQILTEALLNKHHDPLPEHSEWTEGPNDPVQKLKKQLAEKEKTLVEEKEASNALQAKLKELRASLNAERSGAAAAKRAAEQAAAEAHALQARLDQLLERNRELAQESHVAKLAVEAEAQSHKVQLEMHVQRFHESEASYLQQLNGHRSELAVLVGELGQARCEAAAARDAAALAQQHAAELAQQLQDVTRAFSELEQQRLASTHDEQRSREAHAAVVNDLQKRVHELTAQLQAAESGAHALREDAQRAVEEKQQLVSEIASQREQLALLQTELSELKQLKAMPSQNGLLAAEVDDNGRHKMGELEKVQSALEQLRGELAAARRDLAERTELLQRARDQLQHYQDKNNELRTKNWKVMEALQSAEKALQTKTATAPPARHAQRDGIIEEVANVLRSVCPEAEPEPLAGGVSLSWLRAFAENVPRELRLDDLRKQNVQLQEQADKYKQIIDETDGMLTSLQKNAAESEYGWVQKFAAHEKLIDELRARIDSQGDEVGRLRNTLSEEKHRWAQQLAAKQRELDELRAQKDTQGDEVGRLRNTLSEEEHRWAQQLAAKQRELDELRAQKDTQMQTKIESLETDLKREQATNHSQSFAEAERTTEERLMSVLSEKLKVDSKNGPSKTELEKI